jgi:hypothetical protein
MTTAQEVRSGLEPHFVECYQQVFDLALAGQPEEEMEAEELRRHQQAAAAAPAAA